MSRRIIAFAALFAIILPVVSACGSIGAGEESTPLTIVSGGSTEYVIVRNDLYSPDNLSVRSAVDLRRAILAATGAEISLKTDWDGQEDNTARKEILVGDTNRQESKDALEKITGDQFIIKVYGDGTKIVITGKDEFGTAAAVRYFCENFVGYRSETEYEQKDEVVIPLELEVISTYIEIASSDGGIIPGSSEEASLIWQEAGTVEAGRRMLSRTDVLIYKLNGKRGKGYTLELDIEGEYYVTVSPDGKNYSRLFSHSDNGYATARGKYSADVTQYFADSDTLYVRISDYNPTDGMSPIIYSVNLIEKN
ncbi:MAG TPA: hypothetical protein PK778_08450 [Bacillota bacterium]|nr:hypothetical protein [Bacillota bacterium]